MDNAKPKGIRMDFCHGMLEISGIMEAYAAISGDEITEKAAGVIMTLACCVQEIDQHGNHSLFDSLVTFCDELCDKGLESHGVNPNDV